jgi:hypothetical protein
LVEGAASLLTVGGSSGSGAPRGMFAGGVVGVASCSVNGPEVELPLEDSDAVVEDGAGGTEGADGGVEAGVGDDVAPGVAAVFFDLSFFVL